ncbi:MAG: carbon-nitrogen hydrolase family protein [Verrucomicrobiales bacterium]|nr:carbon-nitrogen hydrolase family protein [Verrucomicrobiales bacterium]
MKSRSSERVAVVRLARLFLPALLTIPTGQGAGPAGPDGKELIRHPGIVREDGQALAEGWLVWEAEWETARLDGEATPDGWRFASPDRPFAAGGLQQTIDGIHGGSAYAVTARCRIADVAEPLSSVMVRVEWMNDAGPLHPAGILVNGPRLPGGEGRFSEILVAPADATRLRLSLETRWLREGTVVWRAASVRPAEAPAPRPVKVGAVYLRPLNSTPERNLELWCEQVDAAGRLGLDIVCLSEAILSVGTPATTSAVAEPVPGPTVRRLGEAARRNRLWIVAGVMERDGPTLYNTAVLLNRDGELAGRYRKVHLPREEWRKGITPGDDYPVFQTDFGVVGIQICYDYFFPETTRILAGRGAEIVLAPTWGTTFADADGRVEGRTVCRTRARDNGVYLVTSVYDGDSLVIDPLGRVLATSGGATGVFHATIDLAERQPLWWVGEWRSLQPRHRRPGTYPP